jgi:HEAT repeat protein
MDKLVERETAPRKTTAAPALAVQFFLIPLAVVAVVVCVYFGFRMMLADQRSAQDYLSDIQFGGRERRWPAAYELSRLLADPDVQKKHPDIGRALVAAFRDARGEDPRVRRYLALAIGRVKPAPPQAVAALTEALDDPDTETRISIIWALGAIGDTSVVPALQIAYGSDDAGIRKVTVYALGALPGDAQVRTLRTALADTAPDVQWNAAVALARHGDPEAAPVLRKMLDRRYVESAVTRAASERGLDDPAGEVMINGLRAVGALRIADMRDTVTSLSRADRSLRVRQAAIETLRQIG